MKEKPIKKAWECIPGNFSWYDYSSDHERSIVYAKTRSKAKYRAAVEWNWFEYGQGKDMIYIRARRSPKDDLYEAKPAKILSELTEDQVKIIAHSNGNDSERPGYRDYYYCSSVDEDLLHLVKIGLMIGPQHVNSGMLIPGNGYFYLTDEGKSAAFSMLPRKGVA